MAANASIVRVKLWFNIADQTNDLVFQFSSFNCFVNASAQPKCYVNGKLLCAYASGH